MKRAVMVGLLVVALFCAWTQSALGLWGDVYDEGFNGGSGWRGVAGHIYLYDWTLVPSPHDGRIVNSLYVRDVNCNPYDARWDPPLNFNDGYYDGTPHNFRHIEVGIQKGEYDATTRWVFWQWNNNPNDVSGDWDQKNEIVCSGVGWLPGLFKIENVSMGNSGYETWRMYYAGLMMREHRILLVRGRATVSAERLWLASYGGDSPLAHFKDLQRKNSNGDWPSWCDAHPLADGDNQAHFTKNSNTDLSHSSY